MSYIYKYPRPMVTVDSVVFALDENQLQVLLIKRLKDPFKGSWALPGGFVDNFETVEEAAERELFEETGLDNVSLCSLKPYSTPDRDPRGRNISFAHLGLVFREDHDIAPGDDASEAVWVSADNIPTMAFDHGEIISDALLRIRELVFTSDILLKELPQPFPEVMLISALEIIMGGGVKSSKVISHYLNTNSIEEAGSVIINGNEIRLFVCTSSLQ